MKQSWLIQRLLKPREGWENNPFNFGGGFKNGGLSDNAMNLIKGIFEFDYMGAAEFEWGAVPEALNIIAKSASTNSLTKGSFKPSRKYTKLVYYICQKEHEEYVKNFIKSLLKPKSPMLKEMTLLDAVIEDKEYCRKYCGWLELDNGFFFFTDKDMFEKTSKLFSV